MIAAVVLAAGASRRLGEPKQLVRLGGETLLERAVRVAREAGCRPVVVVLGAAAESVRAGCALGDALVVVNEDWGEGMASSIRLGVRTLGLVAKEAEGAVFVTCDQPAVTAEHLRQLMAGGAVMASAYAGRKGVPAFFPAGCLGSCWDCGGMPGRGSCYGPRRRWSWSVARWMWIRWRIWRRRSGCLGDGG